MPHLIEKFTFDRNCFLRTPEASANLAAGIIESVRKGADFGKTENNKVGAFASYMGLLKKGDGKYTITPLADAFLRLYYQSKEDSWRWLVTRSCWLYIVPNGTRALANPIAKEKGIQFDFFRKLLQVLTHLRALPEKESYLYYDELLAILADDNNWGITPDKFFQEVISHRRTNKISSEKPGLLGDLEDKYGIPRDNFNGLFNKVYEQTGLFKYAMPHNKVIGIALKEDLDEVLQERVRFIIDNPPIWTEGQDWLDYLAIRSKDLPLKVSQKHSTQSGLIFPDSGEAQDLIKKATEALNDVGFSVSEELVHRYIASLFTKRFVILSGLTGSGKTKLAQLIAAWLDVGVTTRDPFHVGASLQSDRAVYRIRTSNEFIVELQDESNRLTPIPRPLIAEWVTAIETNGFDRQTSAETIREAAKENSAYSNFIHGYASHLKSAAFYMIEHSADSREESRYEVVPVEANWGSIDDVFGYADALDNKKFIRRPALDLILRANSNYVSSAKTLPYFLILDEMNLSHVERYFAVLLSAIESNEFITLHADPQARDGVPNKIKLPPNLFIIGTINVDETTYQFSPKVLDRANVIEFRVASDQMKAYLGGINEINIDSLTGTGAGFAEVFPAEATRSIELGEQERNLLTDELILFYEILSEQGAEFGFRTAKEVNRFIAIHKRLSSSADWSMAKALDAQILQKLLPRIHGSQRKLEPLLRGLAFLCHESRDWQSSNLPPEEKAEMRIAFLEKAKEAMDTKNRDLDPLTARKTSGSEELLFSKSTAYLPMSFEKIVRMLQRLNRDGFTSFAEA